MHGRPKIQRLLDFRQRFRQTKKPIACLVAAVARWWVTEVSIGKCLRVSVDFTYAR
jgi:hypothetical protein